MTAKALIGDGLEELRRERVRSRSITKAFEEAIFGTEEQRQEYQREVIQEAVMDVMATHEPPPKTSLRKKLIPNWAWAKHYRR
jgi:hypothetical protein